jgi:hypothetical protein
MNFKHWLNEVSYTERDIPKYFFVGIRWDFEALKKRQLPGVKGISENLETAHNLGEEGIILAMPGRETEKINQLSKVLYDNPYYAASKNWEAAIRVINFPSDDITADIVMRSLMNITDRVKEIPPISDSGNARRAVRNLIAQHFPPFQKLSEFQKEFWRRLHLYISPGVLTWDTFRGCVARAINEEMGGYKPEKEWRVKNETLNVPKGTIIFCYEDLLFDLHRSNGLQQLENDYKIIPFKEYQTLVNQMANIK